MYNRKQLLDFAFEEALSTCNLGDLDRKNTIEILTTAMNGYAAREGVPFTAEEVRATIMQALIQ